MFIHDFLLKYLGSVRLIYIPRMTVNWSGGDLVSHHLSKSFALNKTELRRKIDCNRPQLVGSAFFGFEVFSWFTVFFLVDLSWDDSHTFCIELISHALSIELICYILHAADICYFELEFLAMQSSRSSLMRRYHSLMN